MIKQSLLKQRRCPHGSPEFERYCKPIMMIMIELGLRGDTGNINSAD